MTDKPASPFAGLDRAMIRSTRPVMPADQNDAVDKSTSPQVHKSTSGEVDKPTNPLTDKRVRPQAVKPTSGQTDKTTSGEVDKPTNQFVDKLPKPQVVKYTTHLRPATVKMIKQRALDEDRRDYEIVQDAIDAYLARGKKGDK